MSFLGPLRDPESPVCQILTEYNTKFQSFMQRAKDLSVSSSSGRLQVAAMVESDRARKLMFVENPIIDEHTEIRRKLLSIENPTDDQIANLGNISLLLNDCYTAVLCYSSVLANAAELSPGQQYLMGIAFGHFGAWNTVIQLLEPVIDILADPYCGDATFRLAISHKRLGNLDRAFHLFSMVIENCPPWFTSQDVTVELSQVCFLQGKTNYALLWMERVTSQTPSVLQQQAFLSLYSDDLSKIEQGIQMLNESKATVFSGQLLYLKGRLLQKCGNLKDAFQALIEALSFDSHNPLVWTALGNIYLRMSQITDAQFCYQRAIANDQKMTEAWVNLATCIELDPSLRNSKPDRYFESMFEASPIRVSWMRRRNDIRNITRQALPTICEVNDRDRFPPAADMIDSVAMNSVPLSDNGINLRVVENVALLVKQKGCGGLERRGEDGKGGEEYGEGEEQSESESGFENPQADDEETRESDGSEA
jgi:tetratricopeptide (TPR) repeat protein